MIIKHLNVDHILISLSSKEWENFQTLCTTSKRTTYFEDAIHQMRIQSKARAELRKAFEEARQI